MDGHHIRHWAGGGETSLENLVTLCRHHHRLVHEGGYGVSRTNDGGLRFTRPDGRVIAGPGAPRATHGVEQLNRAVGLRIVAATGACRWLGERMDNALALEGLMPPEPAVAVGARSALPTQPG